MNLHAHLPSSNYMYALWVMMATDLSIYILCSDVQYYTSRLLHHNMIIIMIYIYIYIYIFYHCMNNILTLVIHVALKH